MGFSLKKNKQTNIGRLLVYLQKSFCRISDSAVFIQAGLPEASEDLSCEHSKICLRGGFHKVYDRGTFYM